MSGSDVLTRTHYDAGERRFHFERWQDCEDIVEGNKLLQTMPQRSDWGRHVARVPNIFIEKWLGELWDRGARHITLFHPEFKAYVARKLEDPDFSFLRVDR
jgi:hypothetical protein